MNLIALNLAAQEGAGPGNSLEAEGSQGDDMGVPLSASQRGWVMMHPQEGCVGRMTWMGVGWGATFQGLISSSPWVLCSF